MRKFELLERVTNIVSPVLTNLGYELVEVALAVSHGRRTLRVFIHKPGGVGLDDCARVSKAIGSLLDEESIFDRRYYLEVSSPGAERKLKTRQDFRRFAGRRAVVRLREPRLGSNRLEGRLRGLEGDTVRFQPEGEDAIGIEFDNISSANLCL
jgi:ribosome maturation factor RimP